MSEALPNPVVAPLRRDGPGGDPIEHGRRAGVLTPLDQHFANRLAALFDETDPAVRWAIALACRQESLGHVCADLRRLAAEGLTSDDGIEAVDFPALVTHASVEDWLASVAASPLVDSDSCEGEARIDAALAPDDVVRPLVLDSRGRLYLRRLQQAELALARALLQRA